MERELCYYRRRAIEEGLAARQATDERARQRHFELAAAYELKVRDLKARQRRLAFHVVTAA